MQIDDNGVIYVATSVGGVMPSCAVSASAATGGWTTIGSFSGETCGHLRAADGMLVLVLDASRESATPAVMVYSGSGTVWNALDLGGVQSGAPGAVAIGGGVIYVGVGAEVVALDMTLATP